MDLEDVFSADLNSASYEANSRFRHSRPRRERQLRSFELTDIKDFLRNPTRKGIWQLEANWKQESLFSNEIWSQFSILLENKHSFEITFGKRKIEVTLNPEEKDTYRNYIFDKLSFVFYAFNYALLIKNKSSDRLDLGDEEYQVILEAIDFDAVMKMFAAEIDFFEQNIYFENFHHTVKIEQPYQISSGLFFLSQRISETNKLKVTSLQPKSLKEVSTFLEKIGKIENPRLRPIYSPEETVFEPYFSYTQVAYTEIIDDLRLIPIFRRAFEDFEGKRYSNSISNIGQVAEDYLTQIYETLFRDMCPKGFTLGQLVDAIHSRIRNARNSVVLPKPNLTTLYDEIKKLLKQPRISNKNILLLTREVLNASRIQMEYNDSRIDGLLTKKPEVTIFPKQIFSNLTELIRNRNASSHKTRVPLGKYEALKSLYCLISTKMWWDEKISEIDWDKNPEEIIDYLIDMASSN